MIRRVVYFLCLLAVTCVHATHAVRLNFGKGSAVSSAAASDVEGDDDDGFLDAMLDAIGEPISEPLQKVKEAAQRAQVATTALGLKIFGGVSSVLLYKPPVGIVAAFVMYRLIASGKLFGKGDDEKALDQSSKGIQHKGRSLDLDKDDVSYQESGGIERVRQRLCWAAVNALLQEMETGTASKVMAISGGAKTVPEKETPKDGFMNKSRSYLSLLRPQAEQSVQEPTPAKPAGQTEPPRASGRAAEMMKRLKSDDITKSMLQASSDALAVSCEPGNSRTQFVEQLIEPMARLEAAMAQTSSSSVDPVIKMAAMAAEIRTLDALLRMSRDRLLRTCSRLTRTEKHWRRRVGYIRSRNRFLRRLLRESSEGDRLRLAFAETATKEEMAKLGDVVDVLLQRPVGMEDSCLTEAVRLTAQHEIDVEEKNRRKGRPSRFRFLISTSGKGFLSLRSYDEKMTVGGESAIKVLQEREDTEEWLRKAEAWAQIARKEIYKIVKNSLDKSVDAVADMKTRVGDLENTWCVRNLNASPEVMLRQWRDMFELTRDSQTFRRVGEGRTIRLREASFIQWARQYNLEPALQILTAYAAHIYLKPYFPVVTSTVQEACHIIWGIVRTRFYEPVRDIVNEIMNKGGKSLLEDITSADEEVSLDNMLRDLGFGDGTPATRQEAMQKASRQYESDMDTGLIRHAVGGRLIRLILVQVQQLKVGMLNAAESIDVLLQANRFNIQLLAIIPALVIFTVCTRVTVQALFHLRSKNWRPIGSVHSEMSEYLDDLESIILLADHSQEAQSAKKVLSSQELGTFLFKMHSYLVLLDYSSPPLPSRSCDSIHKSLQEFLGSSGTLQRLSVSQQSHLIGQLKSKHESLKKHL